MNLWVGSSIDAASWMSSSYALWHSHCFYSVERGSERITGSDILVKSWPANFPIRAHTDTFSFSSLKCGSFFLDAFGPLATVKAKEPLKFLAVTTLDCCSEIRSLNGLTCCSELLSAISRDCCWTFTYDFVSSYTLIEFLGFLRSSPF